MHSSGSPHRLIAFVLLVATTLSACSSWQVQTVAPETVVSTEHPKAVRIQRMDGSKVVVDGPRVSADSLMGSVDGKSTGMLLADIYQLAVRRGSPGKTVGLALGIIAGVIVVAGVAAAIYCNGEYNCGW